MWMEQICLLPNTVADGFLILIRHSFFFPVKNQIANLLQALQQKHHNLPYLILLQNRSCLTWKKFTWKICFTTLAYFKIAQRHYNHYKSLTLKYLMYQWVPSSGNLCNCTCFWHHAIFDMLQKIFNCSYRDSTSLAMRIIKTSTHWGFTCSNSAIETLEQGVKFLQSHHKRHQKDVKWRCSGVFIVNLYIILVNSIEFEQVNTRWAEHLKNGVF